MNKFWASWVLTAVVIVGMDVSGFDVAYAEEFPWWLSLMFPAVVVAANVIYP